MSLTIVRINEIPEIKGPYGTPWPHDDVFAGVGPGWRDLVRKLIRDLWLEGWDGQLDQIKEKFGGLRFYIGGATDVAYDLILKAENLSYTVCESCGRPGKCRNDRGWQITLCGPHYCLRRLRQKAWRVRYRINAIRRRLSKGWCAYWSGR